MSTIVINIIINNKVLQRVEDECLTLSCKKQTFKQLEILMVGHLCGTYGRNPSLVKVDANKEMKEECK